MTTGEGSLSRRHRRSRPGRHERPPRSIHHWRTQSMARVQTIMNECEVFGVPQALKLNPGYCSLRQLYRRFEKYRKEKEIGMEVPTAIQHRWGVASQTFTPEQEQLLATNIRAVIEAGHVPVDLNYIRKSALDYWNYCQGTMAQTRRQKPFVASDRWIARFKARHNFGKVKPKIVTKVKCPSIGQDEDGEKFNLCIMVHEAIEKYGLSCVLNFDETPCKIVEKPTSVWSAGPKNQVRLLSDASPKAQITLLPTISADGKRLPLGWINKGETTRGLLKMMNIPKDVFSYFSKSGWIKEDIFINYLRDVIQGYLNGRPGALLLDSYACHWTPAVQAECKKLNLEMILVPKGLTSSCQPLDISFNGPMKQIRTKKWMQERMIGELHTDNVERTVKRAYEAFKAVEDKMISKGFAIICPSKENEIMHRYRPRND
jgi:DDE superfamily endonuclease/Tc5 transposase DNA-binding domain